MLNTTYKVALLLKYSSKKQSVTNKTLHDILQLCFLSDESDANNKDKIALFQMYEDFLKTNVTTDLELDAKTFNIISNVTLANILILNDIFNFNMESKDKCYNSVGICTETIYNCIKDELGDKDIGFSNASEEEALEVIDAFYTDLDIDFSVLNPVFNHLKENKDKLQGLVIPVSKKTVEYIQTNFAELVPVFEDITTQNVTKKELEYANSPEFVLYSLSNALFAKYIIPSTDTLYLLHLLDYFNENKKQIVVVLSSDNIKALENTTKYHNLFYGKFKCQVFNETNFQNNSNNNSISLLNCILMLKEN